MSVNEQLKPRRRAPALRSVVVCSLALAACGEQASNAPYVAGTPGVTGAPVASTTSAGVTAGTNGGTAVGGVSTGATLSSSTTLGVADTSVGGASSVATSTTVDPAATTMGGATSSATATTGTVTGVVGTSSNSSTSAGGATGATTTSATTTSATTDNSTAASTATTGDASAGTTPITIFMAGDSTMVNCNNSACPCGWGSAFAPYFNANVTIQNAAVSGRSIQTWLYEAAVSSTIGGDGECVLTSNSYDTRWTSMLDSMAAGDYLMIAFGINDTSATCPRHVGSERYVTLLGEMAQAAKQRGVNVIFLTPTSAIACNGDVARKTGSFLTETNTAGSSNDVPVIDLNQATLDLYNSLGLCPNAGDYSSNSAVGLFFCDDYIHFEASGASQVAGLVADALRSQSSPLAAYLL